MQLGSISLPAMPHAAGSPRRLTPTPVLGVGATTSRRRYAWAFSGPISTVQCCPSPDQSTPGEGIAMTEYRLTYTIPETAKALGVSESTIRRWIRADAPRDQSGRHVADPSGRSRCNPSSETETSRAGQHIPGSRAAGLKAKGNRKDDFDIGDEQLRC
jgi:hypothetical protein